MLFFPSHDIALSLGVRHFNPPAAALSLQEDLSWLADIWNFPSVNERLAAGKPILPWGWDWDTREHLARHYKIPRAQLPTDSDLETIRQLSNRRSSVSLLKGLEYQGEMPQYLDSESSIRNYIEEHDAMGRPFVLKTPWSSSGRGLIRSEMTPRGTLLARALATLRKMGGIMGEPWLNNKEQDFAMLFYASSNEVRFVGYSLFDNDANGTYRQGYLLSNETIRQRLNCTELEDTQNKLTILLTELLSPLFGHPWHLGYLGIDMMTLRAPADTSQIPPYPYQTHTLMPCVELNLRCTMGVVARLWADRNLPLGKEGHYSISPMSEQGHFHAEFQVD